jgi:soluble cytochrome b562
MKHHWIGLACAAVFAAASLNAEETPLGKQMEVMAKSFKAIGKETDPAKGAILAREAQQATMAGLAELPAMLSKMPEGPEKSKAVAAYRTMMAKVLVTFCQIEEAFLAGKIDDVTKLSNEVKSLRKAGHDRFMEEE